MQQLQVTTKAIRQAVALLTAAGAQFKIISPDGSEFGTLSVAPQRIKRNSRYGYGALLKHAQPFVESTKCCEVAIIPFGEFDGNILRGSIAAYLSREWGKDSYISTVNETAKVIEILRTK